MLTYASCQMSALHIIRWSFRIGCPNRDASSIPFNLLESSSTCITVSPFHEIGMIKPVPLPPSPLWVSFTLLWAYTIGIGRIKPTALNHYSKTSGNIGTPSSYWLLQLRWSRAFNRKENLVYLGCPFVPLTSFIMSMPQWLVAFAMNHSPAHSG